MRSDKYRKHDYIASASSSALRVGFEILQISTQPGCRLPCYPAFGVEVAHRVSGSFGLCEDSGQNRLPIPSDATTPEASGFKCLVEILLECFVDAEFHA